MRRPLQQSSSSLPSLLLLLAVFGIPQCPPVLAGPVRFDQSQVGDYNVHLDLKNIDVIAILDGGLGSDYEYDYNDYTLKPTSAPGSPAGGGGSSSEGLKPPPPVQSAVPSAVSSGQQGSADREKETTADEEGVATAPPTSSGTSTTQSPTTSKPVRRCGAGFFRDPTGRCRRLRRPVKLGTIIQKATNRIAG